MPTLRLLIATLLLAVGLSTGLSVGVAAPARAGDVGSRAGHGKGGPLPDARTWPRGRITIFDASLEPEAVQLALSIWNDSGLRVHFRQVSKRGKADVVIYDDPANVTGGRCGNGRAGVGVPSRGRQGHVYVAHGTDADGQGCAVPGQTLVLVHELGHVLGLGHETRRCSVMNPSHHDGVAPTLCLTPDETDDDSDPGRWMCNPLQVIDLKRVKKLYGGTVRPQTAYCDIVPFMPTAGPITVAVDPGAGSTTATVVRLPEPGVPSYLAVDTEPPSYEIHRTPGACTAVRGNQPSKLVRMAWTAAPGAGQAIPLGHTDPGTWCFTAFVYDNLRRYALAGTTTTITVAPPG